ncbi:MAG: hypothetical protein MUD05_10575 [Candidatus Nanopelagicales bacterium]|jgi:hypothetical protein|nr:hypothetical protein [Candidatus Nanopelagicales bacterium]
MSQAPEYSEEAREWLREAVTMALYISLSLLAVLVALPSASTAESDDLWLTILLTAVALLFAHQLAFRISSRLVNKGLLDAAGVKLLGAQLIGGLIAAVAAALPVLVFGSEAVRASELILLLFVAATGYRAARSVPASRLRALMYVGVVVVGVIAVLFLKSLVGH